MVTRSIIIDQATYVSGYAIVEDDPDCHVSFGVTGRLIQHGVIRIKRDLSLFDRLAVFEADVMALHRQYKFEEMVIEDTVHFYERNVNAKMAAGALYQKCFHICEQLEIPKPYVQSPKSIKKDVAGSGDATKEEVMEATARMWGMSKYQFRDDNHSDAMAGALRWLVFADSYRQKRAEKGGKA